MHIANPDINVDFLQIQLVARGVDLLPDLSHLQDFPPARQEGNRIIEEWLVMWRSILKLYDFFLDLNQKFQQKAPVPAR